MDRKKKERIGSNVINVPPSSVNTRNGSYGGRVKWGLSREEIFRGFMSLTAATSMESVNPGSFNKNLAKLLSANSLPTFSAAGLVPSSV